MNLALATGGRRIVQAVIDSLVDIIAVLDEYGIIIAVNKAWRTFAQNNGGNAALINGIGINYLPVARQAASTDAYADAVVRGIENVMAGRESLFTLEYPCHAPDCKRWYELSVTPLQHMPHKVLLVHSDITQRRLAEQAFEQKAEALRRSERDMKSVLNNVSSMIGYWDCDLHNRYANHAYLDWFGIDPATIPGKHLREVIGEERYALNLPYVEAALRGEAQQFERSIPAPDGHSIRHSLARYLPDVVNGEVLGFFVEVTDVTQIKTSEQTLQRAQEIGQLGSYVTDLTTQRWRGTPMLEQLLGIAPAAEHSLDEWSHLLLPEDRPAVLDKLAQTVTNATPFDMHYRIVRASDSAVRWMHARSQVTRAADGTSLKLVGTVQDITERKEAALAQQHLLDENTRLVRELLAVQDRERASLARELHDELSQHLTAIRAFAGAIRLANPHDVDHVQIAAQSIENSARDIYQVSHRLMEGLHPSILDSAGIIPALGSLLENWGLKYPDIEWRAALANEVRCPNAQFRVAVYRLVQECLSNVALHAQAHRLRIVLANFDSLRGPMLRLVVRDDGVGMDINARNGGFGLLGMRERVLSLGGSFCIASWPNGGTRIRAVLPLS